MILTVRQSEDLFCPYFSASGNKTKCVSERCPLWRWVDTELVLDLNMPRELKAGYCGAGGRPEVFKLEKL
jgi:hypothetical protein